MLQDAGAAFLAGGLLILIGILLARGINVPGELWGLAGTVFGYFFRGASERRGDKKR